MEISKDDLMGGLFGNINNNFGQPLPKVNNRQIVKIPLELIDDLKSVEHAYEKSLEMGIGIEELAKQISAVGQQQPAVVRKKENGRYELIIGHRRKRACTLADTKTLDSIIIDCSDDEVAIISTDNLGQRPHTFPSEIAKAYKIQIDAIKRQGKRTDLINENNGENNFGQSLPKVENEEKGDNNFRQKLPEVNARDVIAQKYKISPRKVSNFLRLNMLIDDLLDLVDSSDIPFMAGVNVSHLSIRNQQELAKILIKNPNIKLTVDLSEELKESSRQMELNHVIIEAIVNPPVEECNNNYIKKNEKPIYKRAIKGVEKYIKKLSNKEAERLSLVNADELQEKLENVIRSFIYKDGEE